jgi:hypothetical protein
LSRRARIVGFGSAALLVVAGIACAFVFSGGLAQNLAFALVALGMVEATSLVFAEVGFSEDRERAREERARAKEAREGERAESPRHPRRPERSPLGRARGRPRRLR